MALRYGWRRRTAPRGRHRGARYLDGEHGLAGGAVRALLNAPGPVVIIATMWPDRYNACATLPAHSGPDPYAREREVLDLAAVIRISPQFGPAEQNWFEQAMAYATEKLHGAVAALIPAGAGMGEVEGYIAADYLIQHARRERRYVRVPASTWDAALTHVRSPGDIARLADSARARLLYRYAISLYRHVTDTGNGRAAVQLAELLAQRGDLDKVWRSCAP